MRRQKLILSFIVSMILSGCAPDDFIASPLPLAELRPTPLHFGLFVTPDPEQNPIDPPERFTGYHVATDFEILEGEENAEIPVFAICSGQVAYSAYAEGYGGLVVQRCKADKQDVTVLYGHLTIAGLPEEDVRLKVGDQISTLAPAHSYDSGGNRKHLHLGIHKGRRLDFRGYVQTQQEIVQFVDPLKVLTPR